METNPWKIAGPLEQLSPEKPMLHIPPHVCTAFGVVSPILEDDLLTAVSTSMHVPNLFGLDAQEFIEAVKDAIDAPRFFEFSSTTYNRSAHRFLEFMSSINRTCTALQTSDGPSSLPTEAGRFLVAAWLNSASVLNEDKISPNYLVWGTTESSFTDFERKILHQWGDTFNLQSQIIPQPIWCDSVEIKIDRSVRFDAVSIRNNSYETLFVEALSELKPKWRYLSLYRILEHGYLHSVYEVLTKEFFRKPTDALSVALSTLQSEKNQFIELMRSANLSTSFDLFYGEFKACKDGGNKFAIAICRSIELNKEDKELKNRAEKGVLICYKLRCSIVHAGSAYQIFEEYEDAPDCLSRVLPTLELLVLSFLGISIP